MSQKYFFYISIILLSLMLYYPVSKLIYILSVRRLYRKKALLTEREKKMQINRSRFITIFLVIIFSYLFNLKIL